MGGGGGGQQSTSTTAISPEFKPFIKFSLNEAKKNYLNPGELPSQLYVDPSADTTAAMNMARDRAMAGNPLVPAAQDQLLQTIQGNAVNPFLAGALEAAYQPTVQAGQEMLRGLEGKASAAGRYGSDAAAQAYGKAAAGYGQSIGNAMAQLTYNSSEAERARQMNALQLAPTLANADYNDIDKLLKLGQLGETYDLNRIQGQLAMSELPQRRLKQATDIFYGAPMSTTTTQQATPTGGK